MSVIVDKILYTLLDNGEATTGDRSTIHANALYKSYEGVIDIRPSVVIDGKNIWVTEIGQYSFYGCSKAKGLRIPSTIRIINQWAISSFVLDELIVPASVLYMGLYALDNCQKVKLIVYCGYKTI